MRLFLILFTFGSSLIYMFFMLLFLTALEFGFTRTQIMTNILSLSTGVLVVILALDLLLSPAVLRRHTREMDAAFLARSLENATFLSQVLTSYSVYGLSLLNYENVSSLLIIVIGLYLSFRIFFNRYIVVKSTLLLLSSYYLVRSIQFGLGKDLIRDLVFFPETLVDLGGITLAINFVMAVLAFLFFLSAYLGKGLRVVEDMVITLPSYTRAAIILFGCTFLLEVVNEVTDPAFWVNVSFHRSYIAIPIFNALVGLFVIWASFHPWRISIHRSSKG